MTTGTRAARPSSALVAGEREGRCHSRCGPMGSHCPKPSAWFGGPEAAGMCPRVGGHRIRVAVGWVVGLGGVKSPTYPDGAPEGIRVF